MKNLKKFAALAAVFALSACFALFAACDGGEEAALDGSMTIVLDDRAGTVREIEADLSGFTSEDSAMDVIESLTEEQVMCYKGSNGIYGMMLTDVGVVEEAEGADGTGKTEKYIVSQNAAEGVYLYLYTNVDADKEGSFTASLIFLTYRAENSSARSGGSSPASGSAITTPFAPASLKARM